MSDKSYTVSTATVYEKNGRYYGMIKYYNADGKLKSKSVNLKMSVTDSHGRDNKEKARNQVEREKRKFAAALTQEKRTGTALSEATHRKRRIEWKDIKFHDAIKLWLEKNQDSYQKSTLASMQRYTQKISDYFKEFDLYIDDIRGSDIAEFYDWLRKNPFNKQGRPPSENTIRHYHNVIHKFFNFCIREEVIDINPADRLDKPQVGKATANFYNAEQIKKLLGLFKDTSIYLCVVMAAYYGLRRSEVLGLQWSDIDFDNKIIHIRHKMVDCKIDGKRILELSDKMKTESSKRDLPLLDETAEMLKFERARQKRLNLKNNQYSDFVFRNKNGLPITPATLTDLFRKILAKSDMEKITFHQLRHSFASILNSQNVNMKIIQTVMGHSTFQITANTYTHCTDDEKNDAINVIGNVYSGK